MIIYVDPVAYKKLDPLDMRVGRPLIVESIEAAKAAIWFLPRKYHHLVTIKVSPEVMPHA